MTTEQPYLEMTTGQPYPEMTTGQPYPEMTTEQPYPEMTTEQPSPEMTTEQPTSEIITSIPGNISNTDVISQNTETANDINNKKILKNASIAILSISLLFLCSLIYTFIRTKSFKPENIVMFLFLSVAITITSINIKNN
jgi:hypothetical protein